ncbi:hypothetical protein KAT92_01400, partial [Candidatus Babeliales bacterium]|nr:hypothetical protein [Candidatus Babeliales bacterium]
MEFPNQFVSNWVQEHYLSLIKTHISRLLHVDTLTISLTTKNNANQHDRNIIPASVIQEKESTSIAIVQSALVANTKNNFSRKQKYSVINPNYQFDTFVVGPSNSLAHAAAYAVCQGLGRVYNPLFIYGGTGL